MNKLKLIVGEGRRALVYVKQDKLIVRDADVKLYLEDPANQRKAIDKSRSNRKIEREALVVDGTEGTF